MDASKREYSGSSVEAAAMSKSEPEDIGTKRRSSIDVLSHSLASKYLPSKQSTAQKLILATLNNEHFTVINIENCDNIDQVKEENCDRAWFDDVDRLYCAFDRFWLYSRRSIRR